ncbi:hypothetical protein I5907_12480 [Panacibacter sp. DH6]|uniref:Lipoprotein n=1 Tax=Panacibacter microcysteis TaxID=2793269 RepID=A0A931GYP3_9BACT|nr:hypothetical protein [Panacibacter microcysteis]MBG9377052.1 hypothetical protein [Panacibacter microcysteis]
MRNWITILAAVLIFTSCSSIGEYYTDEKDNDVENIQINSDTQIKNIGFAANTIDSNFNGIIFFKLIDTLNYKNYQLKQIYFSLNNLSSSVADKKLLCIDVPQEIKYNEIADISELKKKIQSGLPLEFVYRFNKNQINEKDKIKVSIKLLVNENGIDTTIEKSFEIIKHTRHKSWFVGS